MGLVTFTGIGHILNVVDAFYKFCWLVQIREATAKSALGLLRKIVASFRCPASLVTDNATQYISREFRRFWFVSEIEHVTTVLQYPNLSQAERVNKNLKSALIAFHSAVYSRWHSQLHRLQFDFQYGQTRSTQGITFSLMMGFKPNLPCTTCG